MASGWAFLIYLLLPAGRRIHIWFWVSLFTRKYCRERKGCNTDVRLYGKRNVLQRSLSRMDTCWQSLNQIINWKERSIV